MGRRTLDVAFLGCGEATRMHSRTLRKMGKDLRLHYASRSRAKAARFRKEHGGVGTFSSYEAAMEDPRIDVVLVATPPTTHLELTLEALEGGKHVIVEKPAFLRPEDFQKVRDARERAGRQVLVAENYFYKPLRERLHRVLAEGLVGRPLLLHVNAVKEQPAAGWRADPAEAGGGALMEGGIHWINFLAGLGLEVERATGFRAAPEAAAGGSEETVLAVLRYRGGAVASLSYSWEVPSPLKGLRISRIFGTEGTVTFESNGVFVLVHGRKTRFHGPRPRDIAGYRGMFEDFLSALRSDRDARMTLEMAERDVRLVRQIYQSMEEA